MNIVNNGVPSLLPLLDLCHCLTLKSADVEDMTFKTGNFKKFPIFVEMLESAIMQVNDV